MTTADLSPSSTISQDVKASTTTPPPPRPQSIYLMPLAERPFFPAQTLPLLMNQAQWQTAIEKATAEGHGCIGLILVKTDQVEHASPEDYYDIGTLVRVHQPVSKQGRLQIFAEGLCRFQIQHWHSDNRPYRVDVSYPETEQGGDPSQFKAYAIAIVNTLKDLQPLNPLYSEELKFFLNRFDPNEPEPLTDFAASLTTASGAQLQRVLKSVNLLGRMKRVMVLIKKELEVAKLQAQIRLQVEDKLNQHQRKFFLREQLKVIRQELGIAKDDRSAEIERLQDKLQQLTLPDTAQQRVSEQLNKLKILELGSPEFALTRNYLDTLLSLPWGQYHKDILDLTHAQTCLDQHHYGLEDVKTRILEFMAIAANSGQLNGAVLLLVGPPGVGKTSLGHAIADSLGRAFYSFSLGGMRDEAEIKGHRRTYIGAMPGKVAQALNHCQSLNPVIMLDEIDKLGSSFNGDPAAALLDVLDPSQNQQFLDHYLDLQLDISKVLFICTANQLDSIPGPLLDRMEIIHLPGYVPEEKFHIAQRYLWPRHLERANLSAEQLHLSHNALHTVINHYAMDAGVRQLDKRLAQLVRKIALRHWRSPKARHTINRTDIPRLLGPSQIQTRPQLPATPGIVLGLAWTPQGGQLLPIEASLIPQRKASLQVTGQLGDVMQESATIAYNYICAHFSDYGCSPDALAHGQLHIHIPQGAVPKDGPSAGISLACACLSIARDHPLPSDLAMTGELTLSGQVLAIGGLREKLAAAKRNHITQVVIPQANQGDYERLPNTLRQGLQVHFVEHFAELYPLLAFPAA